MLIGMTVCGADGITRTIMGTKVSADADDIITFWSVYQPTYVEMLVLVIPSAPQTVPSTFPNESA